MRVNKKIESTHEEWVDRCLVGQAMQRLFDAEGVQTAKYESLGLLAVSKEDAQVHIDYYNENVDELKGYR